MEKRYQNKLHFNGPILVFKYFYVSINLWANSWSINNHTDDFWKIENDASTWVEMKQVKPMFFLQAIQNDIPQFFPFIPFFSISDSVDNPNALKSPKTLVN